MEKIKNGLETFENYLFSYFATRNVNLVYIIKLCITFFFGTLVPGYVFMIVEGQNETPLVPYDLEEDRVILINNLREISKNSTDEEHFRTQVDDIIEEYRELIVKNEANKIFIRNNRGHKLWTLWNSICYAGTVYTTLGYGELTPNTLTGRLLTIIYAIVGIPFFLVALSDFGKFITLVIKFLWSYVRRLYYTGSCEKHKKPATVDRFVEVGSDFALPKSSQETTAPSVSSEETTADPSTFDIDHEFNLPISLTIFLFVVYMFMGALVYSYFEKWPFFESFYFMFISLSTVGFGDFIPHHPFSVVISIFIIFFGLAICTMLIMAIQDYFSTSFQEGELESDMDTFYGSDESLGSEDSIDMDILNLDRERDESVHRLLAIEEQDEALQGIMRSKSSRL